MNFQRFRNQNIFPYLLTKQIFYTFAQIKLSIIFYFYEKIHAFHDAWHQHNRLGTNG